MSTNLVKLKPKAFASDQDVRWCPGCGDYVILSAVHKAMATMGKLPHEHVVVSGIGCSSRFPYYMGTYGFHTIHGRGPTIASGVKTANPDLTVWLVTGDGDGLSIGGNHLLHALRRNLDINILLFNNRVYGLTKGQYSPCSDQGMVTKTSPLGSIEQPINPLSFALSSQSTFIARTYDSDPKHMISVMQQAVKHKGVSFIEIYQNCKIFNHGTFEGVTDRKVRNDNIIYLEHGKPMIFGKLGNKGLRLNGVDPEIVEFDPEAPPSDLLIHDEAGSVGITYLLTRLAHPEFPEPMGVFRSVELPTYESQVYAQMKVAKEQAGEVSLHSLFRRGAETWTIGDTAPGMVSGTHALGEQPDGVTERESYVAELAADAVEHKGVDRVLRQATLADVAAQSETVVLEPQTSVAEAVRRVCQGEALGTILVRDQAGEIVGIVTERDFTLRLAGSPDLEAMKISEIMTPDPQVLTDHDSIGVALNFMAQRGFRRVPVASDGDVKVLTIDDVLDFIRDA